MLYEAKVSYKTRNEKGMEIQKKEWYVLDECIFFGDVEKAIHDELDNSTYKDLDVTDIKRSRIKELANSRTSDDERLFMSEVQDTFTGEDGTEKEIKYKVLFFSLNIDTAMEFINLYIEQGYDMTLVSLKKTKFVDVL